MVMFYIALATLKNASTIEPCGKPVLSKRYLVHVIIKPVETGAWPTVYTSGHTEYSVYAI